MRELTVVGVTYWSDSYPNVRYRVEAMERDASLSLTRLMYLLPAAGRLGDDLQKGRFGKLFSVLRFLWGHLLVLSRVIFARPKVAYVCYPGIFLIWMLSWLPGFFRPRLILDGFLSVYDTAVNDRQLIKPGSLSGRILFSIERRAFEQSARVIVDSDENARFYSKLFSIPVDKFATVPLAISEARVKRVPQHDQILRVLFVGTFVPLQGVGIIAGAIKQLEAYKTIRFVIIGDGQDAPQLEALEKATGSATQLTWHRGHFNAQFIHQNLASADVALGVFGATEKARRVVPLKIYHYLSAGLPVITGETECIRNLTKSSADRCLITVPMADSTALAQAIVTAQNDRAGLREIGASGRQLFQEKLSHETMLQQLLAVIEEVAEGV